MPLVAATGRRSSSASRPRKGVHPDEAVAIGAAIMAHSLRARSSGTTYAARRAADGDRHQQGRRHDARAVPEEPAAARLQDAHADDEQGQPALDHAAHLPGRERSTSPRTSSSARSCSPGSARRPKGKVKIEVTFHIDSEGILNLTARDKTRGRPSKRRAAEARQGRRRGRSARIRARGGTPNHARASRRVPDGQPRCGHPGPLPPPRTASRRPHRLPRHRRCQSLPRQVPTPASAAAAAHSTPAPSFAMPKSTLAPAAPPEPEVESLIPEDALEPIPDLPPPRAAACASAAAVVRPRRNTDACARGVAPLPRSRAGSRACLEAEHAARAGREGRRVLFVLVRPLQSGNVGRRRARDEEHGAAAPRRRVPPARSTSTVPAGWRPAPWTSSTPPTSSPPWPRPWPAAGASSRRPPAARHDHWPALDPGHGARLDDHGRRRGGPRHRGVLFGPEDHGLDNEDLSTRTCSAHPHRRARVAEPLPGHADRCAALFARGPGLRLRTPPRGQGSPGGSRARGAPPAPPAPAPSSPPARWTPIAEWLASLELGSYLAGHEPLLVKGPSAASSNAPPRVGSRRAQGHVAEDAVEDEQPARLTPATPCPRQRVRIVVQPPYRSNAPRFPPA